jgi:inosine/xanthosine triphosphatase
MIIALGSTRAAKVEAVHSTIARIAEIDDAWKDSEVISRDVATTAPAMPQSDQELMQGARERAEALIKLLADENYQVDFYIGLEGGFETIDLHGASHTFLRGWAYATNGEQGSFGASPSIIVPASIVNEVVLGGRELGVVIDDFAGEKDVRSRQGAWGVLSRDLFTRSMSFETALIAALAPFYNPILYATKR